MGKWEDYFIENTEVFKNKLGITNEKELDDYEKKMVVSKLSYLYIYPINGNFDAEHLCEIHKFLFGDLYEFAGEYRTVDVCKIDALKKTVFLPYQEIESELTKLFQEMNSKEFELEEKFEIAKYIGDYYYRLIEIHPFREGNGRTTREFIRELVMHKFPKYELDYTKIDKNNFFIGVVNHELYPTLLAYEIYNGLIERENVREKKI